MKIRALVVATVVATLASVGQFRVSAEVLEQVLVKVNGDILTKTELEAKQIAALRSRINTAVDAEAMKNDETLKKMIAEVTPKILVETIDEMLLLQLGKEKGIHVTDQQFKEWVADIRKGQNLEDDQKFKQALAQEGMTMDDLRRNFERQVTVYRVQQDEVGQNHRGRSAPVLSLAPVGVRRTRNSHAPRDLGRDSDGYQGRAGGYQRRAGRCGADEGGGDPRASDGRRRLRQGRVRGLRSALEGQWRAHRTDRDEGALHCHEGSADQDEAG